MPDFNFVKTSVVEKSFRNESIKSQFDLKIDDVCENFSGKIDIDNKEWNIGLIVGSSGSGKSTIAKHIFPENYIYDFEYGQKSVIDEMPKDKTTEQITKIFNSVGFSTVWSWLKPYHVLSNGEKMRVDLAKSILSDKEMIVFDEFTSVVDRTVAKTASNAISKAVKRLNKKFVAVACHRDIIDWLEPDWIYDTDEKRFFFVKNKDQKLNCRYIKQIQNHGTFLRSFII
jgi:ABC-type ATPase with predicted acetyltransferase domain